MTREDIIRMAREAFGAPYSSYLEKRSWDINDKQVERFAALVAQAEREACAKVCEDFDFEFQDDSAGTLKGAAEAIRARGEK
jgi:hypothetical protein